MRAHPCYAMRKWPVPCTGTKGGGTPGDTSWVWQLNTQPDGTTRLITRKRSRIRWTPTPIAFSGLRELGDFWMIRKMQHGLRELAEGGVAGGSE